MHLSIPSPLLCPRFWRTRIRPRPYPVRPRTGRLSFILAPATPIFSSVPLIFLFFPLPVSSVRDQESFVSDRLQLKPCLYIINIQFRNRVNGLDSLERGQGVAKRLLPPNLSDFLSLIHRFVNFSYLCVGKNTFSAKHESTLIFSHICIILLFDRLSLQSVSSYCCFPSPRAASRPSSARCAASGYRQYGVSTGLPQIPAPPYWARQAP